MLEFKIPEVGENIESGTVVSILVSVGDKVRKDQDLFELETEKASLPVPSPCDGTIEEILINAGDDVKIGQVVMRIADVPGAPSPAQKTETQKPAEAAARPPETEQPASGSHVPPSPPAISPSEQIPTQVDVPAAPSVRRFAREIGIEISKVPGSGPGGRVSEEDVKAYAKQLLTGKAAGISTTPLPDFSKWGNIERSKMSNVRKKTAAHLSACWSNIPHVTQYDKADITELEKLRKNHSTQERKLTLTPFVMKILAAAMKEFPQFNASVDMAANEIVYKKYIHIGIATDTDRGLLVPVIRDADTKDIFQLNGELNEAAEKARARKISLDDLKGGCITLTNLGGIGGTHFAPIINWPEVAILGISRAQWEPEYKKGEIIPGFMLPLSLSYDHRLIDGADGARFLSWIVESMEHPHFPELKD